MSTHVEKLMIDGVEGMYTREDYEEAIKTLRLAMQQLEPDGKHCVICGDNDHQAWECKLNPHHALSLRNAYHCYHCGDWFAGAAAQEHFGGPKQELPQCAKHFSDVVIRLRKELGVHAKFVYNQAILTTPTGGLRDKLTEFNMLRLQTLRETAAEEVT